MQLTYIVTSMAILAIGQASTTPDGEAEVGFGNSFNGEGEPLFGNEYDVVSDSVTFWVLPEAVTTAYAFELV
ncbi:hypothetical protein HYQ46_008404 [Verticillium longisporum]|nr:hypothetical protein HYQ46_008404 [Verticillium longisporum]